MEYPRSGWGHPSLCRVPVTPECPLLPGPLLEWLPSPAPGSGRFQRPLSLAGTLPALCLLPMLIAAADIWPGLRGCGGQHWGAGWGSTLGSQLAGPMGQETTVSHSRPELRLSMLGGTLEHGQAIPVARRHDQSLRSKSGWRG